MTAVVRPLPRNLDELVAWFAALTPADWSNAFLGALVLALAGLLLVLGTMALLRLGRR